MSGSAEVNAKLELWATVAHKGLRAEMGRYGTEMEKYAKTQRPWNNLTGSATEGLQGQSEAEGTGIIATIGHHVEHGLYLEQRGDFFGRYRILEKARNQGLNGLWVRIGWILRGGKGEMLSSHFTP